VKFAAREKVGKGTFVTNLLGHVERGEATVFGDATAPVSALIYSEEPQDSMREKISKAGLRKATIIFGWELAHMLPKPGQRATPWQLKADYLVQRAVEEGHEIAFIDNISRAAGVEDEGGVELARAAEYLFQAAKAQSLTVLFDHHHKKGAGKLADKSRGGTALSGATDNNIEIEMDGGDWTSRVRRVSSRGRVAATNWQRKIALNDDGSDYVVVADDHQPQGSKDRQRLRILAKHFPKGATARDFGEAVELKERAARNALNSFAEAGWATRDDGPPQRWTATGHGLGEDAEPPI
jgi:hypothetical protein